MIKPELVRQIKSQLLYGTDQETIIHSLTVEGWSKEDIDDSLQAAAQERAVAQQAAASQPDAVIEPAAHFTTGHEAEGPVARPIPDLALSSLPPLSASSLFRRAWELYKSRWKTFCGIILLPFLFSVAYILCVGWLGLFRQAPFSTSMLLLGFIIELPVLVLSIWSQIALIYAIKDSEDLGLEESYRRSLPQLGSFIWICFLLAVVTLGGGVCFVIPGLIFTVWFIFAQFVLVDEGTKGMDALLKSREYVRGRWGQVFWLLLGLIGYIALCSIALLIITAIIAALAGALHLTAIQQMLFPASGQSFSTNLSFFLLPLETAYGYFLYRDLKQAKGDFTFAPASGAKAKFALCGILGTLVFAALFASMFLVANTISRMH